METIFMNVAGTVLFVRDDMEAGNWTQEEYTVNATFPYVFGKVIEQGQRVAFRDPATNTLEIFEIINVTNIEPEHYQQFIAEHIAVSELSDEHINTTEITEKTATQALTTVLTGTLWSVGNDTSSGSSSGDIARGSVWQGVCAIMTNWNVYITPRVTVNSAGSITGKYLDISPAQGTWRGVRLSIDKNMSDSSVIYDDSEVYTALYGYGANVDVPQTGGVQDKTEELTFKDVVWTATSAHPAKPADQTYLEDPAKTALYGRNGRARFGYYQNGDIEDAEILLEKTWEALQETSSPKINITGTVTDLYRLGYKDQPLRLHDTVIVEIKETGEKLEKEIIKLDVDLIDPTQTRPEIGQYIQNIVYIARKTDEKSGGGGGGGGKGMTNLEDEKAKYFAGIDNNGQAISLIVGKYNGEYKIRAGEIVLAINDDGGTSIKLSADTIDMDGIVTGLKSYNIECGDITCEGSLSVDQDVTAGGTISALSLSIGSGGIIDCYDIDAADIDCDSIVVPDNKLQVGSYYASWQTATADNVSLSNSHTFLYGDVNLNPTGRASGSIVLSATPVTINYLGR